MMKIDSIKPIVRSRSSSSSSETDDSDSASSSSDSDLSLIETSTLNLTKSFQKKKSSTSTNCLSQGTIIRDVNNNPWMIHQCIRGSHRSGRYIYLCSQVKRSSLREETNTNNEQYTIKTKICPLTHLTEKLKKSRQIVIEKARAENDKLEYVFYSAVIGETNKETEIILPNKKNIPGPITNSNKTTNKNLSTSNQDLNGSKMIHGIVEFIIDDQTEDETKINKYSIEIFFVHDKKKPNSIVNPSELLQQILKREIEKLKEIHRKKLNSKMNEALHKFIIKKKPGQTQYEIEEMPIDEGDSSSPSPTVESSPIKYLLKLELCPSSTPSKRFTIEHEISFYSRYATNDKLKSYVKRHGLMYIAIPEYIAHGTYKHSNQTYKFIVIEQYRENLRSLIYSYDQSLPEHNALNLFLQMLFVMQFIHENNHVHHIIKPKYLMFANKQPYFIYLTQCRTIRSVHETNQTTNGISNENRVTMTNENIHIKQQDHQVKKKVKRSHRTQLAAIHNKTAQILPVIDIPSPVIEEDQTLNSVHTYHHPYSIYSSLDVHLNDKQTYRGDLEMLGYNLIVWSGGQLPWDKHNVNRCSQTKFERQTITNEKKLAKSNVNEFVKKCFFKKLISPVTLRAICDYMSTVYQLSIDDTPSFDQLRAPIKEIVKALGFKANACLRLSNSKSKVTHPSSGIQSANSNSSSNVPSTKPSNPLEKQMDGQDLSSPAKELEVERDDLDEEDDDDDDEDDDDDDDDDDDEDEDDEDDEGRPCPTGSNSSDDDQDDLTTDDDTHMEQQIPSMSGSGNTNKCKRCGGDHSFEDQQSQTSSDKQSNSSIIPNGNSVNNTLTYQQKRQRSIAKRLQLRRKKKN